MNHFINSVEISNFKSFRHLKLDNCFKRINLFIGKPNVGKSNFLEALSLFSIPYVFDNYRKKLTDLVRIDDEFYEIFNDSNQKSITIKVDTIKCVVTPQEGKFLEISFENENLRKEVIINEKKLKFNPLNQKYKINSFFIISIIEGWHSLSPSIKKYSFRSDPKFTKRANIKFLNIPFGNNLVSVLEYLPELRKTFESWFKEYGLRLVLDKSSQSLKIMKDKGDEGVFLLPYSSIADTLQRIIFFKTAIASNENSVLIFEEPEAHAFPPYISEFTQDVINSTTNQFFIATHSPIVVNDFLENAREDLAIFIVDFKDGQTVMKPLSREEIEEVYKYGVDLFFNYENYLA